MPDETDTSTRRYARDMRRIRVDRGVSIEEVQKKTHFPRTLIESFEEGALYDHPTFNRVYLRSFVQSYAQAIDVPSEEALDGLEAALEGTYQHEMADRHLRAAPDNLEDDASVSETSPEEEKSRFDKGEESVDPQNDAPSSDPKPPAGGVEGRGGIMGPPRAADREEDFSSEQESTPSESDPSSSGRSDRSASEEDSDRSDSEAPSIENEANSGVPEDAPEEDRDEPSEVDSSTEEEPRGPRGISEDRPSVSEEPSSTETSKEETAREPFHDEGSSPSEEAEEESGGGSEDRTSTASSETSAGPPSSRTPRASSERRSRTRENRQWKKLLTVLGILLLVGIAGGIALSYYYSTAETEENEAVTQETPAQETPDEEIQESPDQTTVEAGPPTDEPPPASIDLGDTLHVTVLAEANVSELRVRQDQDLRRPYWIEQDSAMVFPFTQRITLENSLDEARLFLEQYPYVSSPDTEGRIVIERETAEAFADTLRGEPSSLSVAPDTIPIGGPSS